MATRPIVPRANGEGSLGITSKYWGNTFTQKLNGANAVDMTDFSTATLRQPSTAQSVGDIRYHATLPAGWYLECTTAGTTGSGALTTTSPTLGGTVSDGTVTWTVRKGASTQDLTGYLPLSGGAMTEPIIKRNNDASYLSLQGGTNENLGACVFLHGKNSATPNEGLFFVVAHDANNYSELTGYPNGTLTWNSNSLDKSAVVAESLGQSGYRKYASGLIVQWGQANIRQNQTTSVVTLPISTSLIRRVYVTTQGTYSPDKILHWNDQGTNTNDQIEIVSNSVVTDQYGLFFSWLMYSIQI
jgi:hypothetical protein